MANMGDERPYSKRELDSHLEEIKKLITANSKVTGDTLEQAKKTNGRVNKLERWQSFMQGGLAILSVIVIPLLIYVFTHVK